MKLSPTGVYVIEVHTAKGNVSYLACDIYGTYQSMRLVGVDEAGKFTRTEAIEFGDRAKEHFKATKVELLSPDVATRNVHIAMQLAMNAQVAVETIQRIETFAGPLNTKGVANEFVSAAHNALRSSSEYHKLFQIPTDTPE